jgi:hypothetical protein
MVCRVPLVEHEASRRRPGGLPEGRVGIQGQERQRAGLFKERNRFHPATATPMVGDLVIFKFSHIGFVEAVDAVNIKTIEGNVNSRVVRVKHPRSSSSIDGYCRPEYHKVEQGGLSMADAQDILRELAEMKRQIDLLYRRANHGDADRSPMEAGGDFNRKAIRRVVDDIAEDVKALTDAQPHG